MFWLNNSARDCKVSPYEPVFGAHSQKPSVLATCIDVDQAVFPDPLGAAALFLMCSHKSFSLLFQDLVLALSNIALLQYVHMLLLS